MPLNSTSNSRYVSNKKKEEAWNRAHIVKIRIPDYGTITMPPDEWRQDSYGNLMRKSEYGQNTEWGYQIDHRRPVSKGGTNHIRNLEAVNTAENQRKSDRYPYNPK